MANLFDTRPRGIRNNNWLNIKFNPRSRWQGLAGFDGTFCIFESPEYGIRAANKILHNYLKSDSKIDVEHTIEKWCPDDTAQAYVRFVCRYCGLTPFTCLSEIFDTFGLYIKFIIAMAFVECGEQALVENYCRYADIYFIVKRGLSMKL